MNDNQELKDHFTVTGNPSKDDWAYDSFKSNQPRDYVKDHGIKCECGEYLHAGHKCVEPPTFKFPWAIVMLFVGIAFGFIMGVTR